MAYKDPEIPFWKLLLFGFTVFPLTALLLSSPLILVDQIDTSSKESGVYVPHNLP